MNIENINKVMEQIKLSKHSSYFEDKTGFNMGGFTHGCGTASCIGGYAAALSFDVDPRTANLVDARNRNNDYAGFHTIAADYLGLDEETADLLFYPDTEELMWEDIEPELAVRVLQNLVETGKVDWEFSK